MPYDTPPLARQLEHGQFNRFLANIAAARFLAAGASSAHGPTRTGRDAA